LGVYVLKVKINELKKIKGLYRGMNKCKKGCISRMTMGNDDNYNAFADSHSILNV